MLKKKLLAFGVLLIFFSSCKEKPPYKPDYENVIGLIIGPENCKSSPSQNAWLIQFAGPNAGNNTYGENITYNNIPYSNIVKTYTLPDTSKIPGQRYLFEFYLEERSTSQECDAINPASFNIIKIRLKNLARIAN